MGAVGWFVVLLSYGNWILFFYRALWYCYFDLRLFGVDGICDSEIDSYSFSLWNDSFLCYHMIFIDLLLFCRDLVYAGIIVGGLDCFVFFVGKLVTGKVIQY